MALAAASQFDSGQVDIHKAPYVNNPEEIPEIVAEASIFPCIIVYTLVLPGLKEILEREASKYGIPTIDILTPLLVAMSKIEGREPKLEPGLVRKVDEEYFRKIEAIEFAVKYDDGKDPRGILLADFVIIGVSRTSKTPLCTYLAHKRVKAANVPLVPEVTPPEELSKIPLHKIIGLTIQPEQLYQIRCERLKALGLMAKAGYASMERILKELEYANGIMQKLNCKVIDITNRAVEETASKLLEIYNRGAKHVKQEVRISL